MIRQRKPLQRHTPLERGKPPRRSAPPKRKTRLKARRATPRRVAVERNEAYKAAVRQLDCVGQPDGSHAPDCRPWHDRQASHVGIDRGQARKADDLTCVAQTDACHKYMERSGKVTKPERRAWAPGVVAFTHAELERRGLYRFAPAEVSLAAANDASGEGWLPW